MITLKAVVFRHFILIFDIFYHKGVITMAKFSGLGKGIDAIFLENNIDESQKGSITNIPLTHIEVKTNQPRKYFDEDALRALSASIEQHGLIQPIVVRELANGRYQIIAGERRFRASKMAELSEIPAIIIDADEFKASQLALIENIQREDLNPLEEAMAYKSLAERFDMTQEEISAQVGKSRSAIANTLRLLDLPDELLSFVASRELSAGHARALLGLDDPADMILLANRVIEDELSVRATEAAVKKINQQRFDEEELTPPSEVVVDYTRELELRMMSTLGRRVKIKSKGAKKCVTLFYEDNEDLENLLKSICGDRFIDEI